MKILFPDVAYEKNLQARVDGAMLHPGLHLLEIGILDISQKQKQYHTGYNLNVPFQLSES